MAQRCAEHGELGAQTGASGDGRAGSGDVGVVDGVQPDDSGGGGAVGRECGDVVEEAGPIGLREGLDVVRDLDALSGDALLVYEALPAVGPRGVRELSELSGVAVDQVRAVLPLLEMEGFVGSDDTGWSRQR